MTWHPRGTLDDALADRIVELIECEERVADAPLHRYTDFSGLSEIRLRFGHTFQIAERRLAGYTGEPVKSAIFCDWIIGHGIAHLYEELMAGGRIEVRAFRNRGAAAEWLGVKIELLQAAETEKGEAPGDSTPGS